MLRLVVDNTGSNEWPEVRHLFEEFGRKYTQDQPLDVEDGKRWTDACKEALGRIKRNDNAAAIDVARAISVLSGAGFSEDVIAEKFQLGRRVVDRWHRMEIREETSRHPKGLKVQRRLLIERSLELLQTLGQS